MSTAIVYLHGFNSGPASVKAQQLGRGIAALDPQSRPPYFVPLLHHRPAVAMRELTAWVDSAINHSGDTRLTFVGSSLGGFYATYLAERHSLRAVLLNPAVTPHEGLRTFLGVQRNLYTHAQYELTEDHLRQWEKLYVPSIRPERYLLIVETGDEVLDYRAAIEKYRGARTVVIEGGDHTLKSFPEQLPLILEFARLHPPGNSSDTGVQLGR
jgi:predicted esterase YcpF (UPF0227 family)